nr:hypothetical protein [Tanacetum cinerariifolium]
MIDEPNKKETKIRKLEEIRLRKKRGGRFSLTWIHTHNDRPTNEQPTPSPSVERVYLYSLEYFRPNGPGLGADEELSDKGSPRVIVYGYDGLPMQPVALPSPYYIPGLKEPQTPPVPQDKDEREPMFIQPHDPDYVSEPMYPEYIPLKDEHVLPAEEQPLPPIDSPTTESSRYVAKSNLKEDPEVYEDDETEDGLVDYPMDGGDDGDDDGNSSGDDANDEDEDEEDEKEEEEHLALADSAIVIPIAELVSPPEGTEPVIPPPSTDTTTGARITVLLQAAISLPPEAKVERLLARPTPPPSPLTSLSPPSAGERLTRCTAPYACPSPPLVPSPLLPSSGCPTQIQTLRMASTQALIDAVTASLHSPPPLYIPPPVDRRDDILKTEMPPRNRLCLSTLGSRYKIRESSTRPTEGADEELSDKGSPRVIVYGYDGLPMQPVALPSPYYIPGLKEPQTPPVPQDKDEREPMFIQPHDPDYVSEPMYPEYIPLKDEHVLPAEEQPLPPIDSPTTESSRYVAKSNLKEDPEVYEDDETEDGLVDYPMDGGDDGDDDGNSSGDDANDEDEDEEDEKEEEEHLALADSAIVIPIAELVSPPEGTEPVIPPPSTDTTTGARITVLLQAAISLPPEAKVERLLARPTPPPSPLTSLSPPSAGERLTRCTAPYACPSPPLVPSPLLPSSGCPTQIQTLRMASTQALIDAVTASLHSPPPLYIPPPVDRRDDILKTEMPPRNRLCLSTLGSRYKIRESSTRPTERVNLLIEDRIAHQETILIVEEEAYAAREAWAHSIGLSQAVHSELQTHRKQTELLALREHPRRARQPGEDARVPDHQDAPRDADSHT